jgi:hypothetical protein
VKRLLLAAVLGSLLSCASDDPQVAGGDDMGNFAQATLVDGDGLPLKGRVRVLADHDTLSLEVQEGGVIRIPSRSRAWIRVIGPQGECILDQPASAGHLGILAVGRPRPLVGWLARTGTLRIPGLGEALRQGGLFRFEAVPPGRMRLLAVSDSFSAALPIFIPASGGTLDTLLADSLALPPLVVTGSALAAADRADTAACGSGCADWIWSRVNVPVPSDSSPGADTSLPLYTRLRLSSTPSPDSGLCDSIRIVANHGNTVELEVFLRGRGVVPRLYRRAGSRQFLVQSFRSGSAIPTALDSAFSLLALIPRADDSLLRDSLALFPDSYRGGMLVLPGVDPVVPDTCTSITGGQTCRASWGRYLLMEP